MKNEILEEVWRYRDEFARQHGYNIDAMVATLQKMERNPLSRIVDRRKVRPTKKTRSTALICH
ncbi:MAG: hypothetical protein NTX50_25335 [Candidatus Sumerlaeota bacterium]|nr:hypothetical protein [Candidatus Sumerlaeota bacterium]